MSETKNYKTVTFSHEEIDQVRAALVARIDFARENRSATSALAANDYWQAVQFAAEDAYKKVCA